MDNKLSTIYAEKLEQAKRFRQHAEDVNNKHMTSFYNGIVTAYEEIIADLVAEGE